MDAFVFKSRPDCFVQPLRRGGVTTELKVQSDRNVRNCCFIRCFGPSGAVMVAAVQVVIHKMR